MRREHAAALAVGMALGCASTAVPFPWPTPRAAQSASPSGHAEVATVNAGYRRQGSQVLVRAISRPTRANLDYAAYHANFMNADAGPAATPGRAGRPDAGNPFKGALARETLTGSLAATPLTDDERRHPLAFAPLVELLVSKHVPGGERLEEVEADVRAEHWGLGGGPQLTHQTATEAYLHDPGAGRAPEFWIKVELAPWFTGFSGIPDGDGDGVPEMFGRVAPERLGREAADVARFVRDDYAGRVLTPAEIQAWAHQLASYWYPSYNTDLQVVPAIWPDADVEPEVRAEVGGQRFAAPTVVLRGKPLGKPVYNVFVVQGMPAVTAQAPKASPASAPAAAAAHPPAPRMPVSPDPDPVARALRAELAAHGGSFARWASEVAPFHAAVRRRLAGAPAASKALAGSDGFLFFRQSLAYLLGGDLARQRRGKNPLPAIVAFKDLLAAAGVDFLFVPVPTKAEVYPDKVTSEGGELVGQVVNPYQRKLLLDLTAQGVEVVDLMPAFLAERGRANAAGRAEALYQAQDTHWTARGLELAARVVAERVKRYPWQAAAAAPTRRYETKLVRFSRHGDLHSRLPDGEKARHAPEALVGHQVIAPGGAPYEDDPESPIVLLGDSFTGVFQLMDCEHAGVSAHLARELGQPIDLVMSYGGGPNVRAKLLRRGKDALATKRLVIWMMTNRDLYDFWDDWQKLAAS